MKRISSILILLMLSVAFVTGHGRVDKVSESGERLGARPTVEYTTEGVKKIQLDRDLFAARELFEKAIQSDSTYAPAHYSLAKLLLESNGDSVALGHAQSAYLSDSTNSWYAQTYAQALLSNERYAESVPIYEKIIKMDPLNLNAYRILAILYQQRQQPHKAIALLDSAELKAGKNPHLVALKRRLLLATSQSERALREARELVEEQPYMPDSHISLGSLYLDLNADSLAEVEFTKALKIDSMHLETLIVWCNFLETRGRNEEYLATLRRVMQSEDIDLSHKIALLKELIADKELYKKEYLKVGDLLRTLLLRYPENETLTTMQTEHLLSLGMIEEAAAWLKSKLNNDPPVLNYFHTVINIESYLKRPDSVEFYIKRAIEKFPNEEELRYQMAFTYSRQERYEQAIELYQEELKRAEADSLRSSIYGMIGDMHHQRALRDSKSSEKLFASNMKECYKAYDKALKYNPRNTMVLNNFAYFLCENGGNLKRALEMSQLSTEIDKGNPTFLDTHAWILYRLGKYAEAKVIMRQAISLDTTQNPEIALHYGEILSLLGEDTMANFYWEQALKWGMKKELVERSRRDAEARRTKEKQSNK